MDLKRDKYSPFISSKISIDKKGQDIEMNLKLTKNTKKLNLSTTISGSVVDKLKNPIDNAIVNLMDENFNPLTYVTTGENGKYLMNDIPYSDSYNLIATANGKLISQANNFSISSQQNLEFNFVLLDDPNALLGIISGKVQDDNNPLLGAIVSLYTIDEDKKNLISITYSDVSGIYTFTELPLGNYSIGISALGYMQFQMPVSVNSGEIISVKSNLSVDPKASDGIISGIIKDSTNLQISDAYVILYRVEDNEDLTPVAVTTTDKNGLYVFINVSTGNYLIKTNDFEIVDLIALKDKNVITSITSGDSNKKILINTTEKGTDFFNFNFIGTWYGDSTEKWATDINSSFSIKFKGGNIKLMGIKDPRHGIYEISIDNGNIKEVDGYSSTRTEIITIFDSGILNYGEHVLNFKLKGVNPHGGRADGQINYAVIDLDMDNNETIDNVTPKTYEIYPKPQNIKYTGGWFQLGQNINVVYDNEVDEYTKNRVMQVLKSQNLESTVSNEIVSGKTNFLVGINKFNGIVNEYFSINISYDKSFFDNNIDSYLISVKDGIIAVLGKDEDSAFYGVTTLKHVFNQIEENKVIQNFRIDDYADVPRRGFIEGYYGNPWSNEDRGELMKFGGDYKLNQYVFAPKDDIYHNKKWRELYPAEDLMGIQKLAKIGNETKNRYVYALHPFMYSAIRFNTEENYKKDLDIIKQKFNQLLDADVRQFAILADDAGVPPEGPSMYVKLLKDLTAWLEQKKVVYTDLKTHLMFCPAYYMGNGSSNQLRELNKAGDNISLVMTGGRIWGEVNENFSNNFINNIATEGYPGRAPFYWINWPCSDNSKQHLIMGGNDTFLHPGVDPSKIDGIVLNPMQQAEANKSALFAISDYAWNIWGNKEEANKNWYDSFKYMDHGTVEETNSSMALRELSKHMINQNMDGRVTKLEESIELAPKIKDFKKKYENGSSIKLEAEALIDEFTNLKNAAAYYKDNAGNPRTRDQIIYWLNCWEDTTNAVISYLNSAIAIESNKNDVALKNFLNGQNSFEKSKTYEFHYVDHMQYAEVGVQHIVPLIKILGESLSVVISSIIDPSKITATFITNREDSPSGIKENIFDQNPITEIVYKNPNRIDGGTYVGIKYSNAILLNNVEFLMGTNANPNDTMQKAKIQYTIDGKEWLDLEGGKEYENPQNIKVENLSLKVKGIRLIETAGKSNIWLGIRDINVNKANTDLALNSTLIRSDIWQVYEGDESNITDGKEGTDVWYKTANGDTSLAGEFIGLNLGKVAKLDQIRFVMGRDGSGDKWRKYKLEYSLDNEIWKTVKEYDNSNNTIGKDIIEESFQTPIEAIYIRFTNLENINRWVIFSELGVISDEEANRGDKNNIYTNTNLDIYSIFSYNLTKLKPFSSLKLNSGEYIGVKLDRIKDLSRINFETINGGALLLQSSLNGVQWSNIVNSSELQDGRYVRAINNSKSTVTFDLNKFEVFSSEITAPKLISAYMDDTGAEKAVDGDLRTSVKFNGFPKKDDTIVYDLGQEILVDNLKYVVLDTEKDHVRDGKIQLSLDGTTWIDAITIGDGVENPANDLDSKPVDNGYKHGNQSDGIIPIDSAYVEGANLNQKARYVRILFTASYNYRWTVINELMINNGEYIQAVNDPTFLSNPIEERGFSPNNLIDGQLTTSYKPNTKNGQIRQGNLTYRLSEKTDIKKIIIVQDGNTISNALINAKVIDNNEEGTSKWVILGRLSNSLNEFITSAYEHVFEIKISWNGVAPNIYEIITLNDEF
ncbi:beta-N-acetylglucosaminidase domain-containing protein [Clostridium tarantellae]|uniref:Hyaluronoglucosaminidase n=1 Tax=Clostridium tarantellae TaxID=39493 RepID=A0A6I1MHI2_9CLOT|nr:beta-N-acetylglucosaminidase domain-containing protein [Clostridium tarantellae]MPQ42996.1 hyaluronoglucosaminidase [Clostridium tarantellae]